MPDITVHNSMGDSVLNRLPEEIAEEVFTVIEKEVYTNKRKGL